MMMIVTIASNTAQAAARRVLPTIIRLIEGNRPGIGGRSQRLPSPALSPITDAPAGYPLNGCERLVTTKSTSRLRQF
jgi:hypothetical protein